MGQQKTTQTTTIPGAGSQENSLMLLLQRLAQQASGQLGDLSGLASGKMMGPTEEDRRLVQQTIGATADIGQRELQRVLGPIMAQLNEGSAGRNIGGSSIESLNKALQGQEMGGRLADLLSQAQGQGAQALLNLPGQRAELQIGANQALFNMLTSAANPVLANQLQSRLAQPTTTQESPAMDWGQIFQTAGSLGAAPFTGGASLAGLGIPGLGGGGGGGGGYGYNPSLYSGFAGGLRQGNR
jgi:hypothetical protein